MMFFAFFSSQKILEWPILRFLGLQYQPGFMDLRSILGAVECSSRNISSPSIHDSLWEECEYIYGSTLNSLLGLLNLSTKDTTWIGWVFIACLSIVLTSACSKFKLELSSASIGVLLCTLSPPIMLLVERANFDVLIVFIVWLATFFHERVWRGVSLGLVAISALFKFYTLPLMLFITLFFKNKFARLLSLAFTLIVGVKVVNDLKQIETDIPRILWNSFGGSSLGLYLDLKFFPTNLLFQNVIGVLQLIFIFLVLVSFQRSRSILMSPDLGIKFTQSQTGRLQIYFIFVFLTCYFAGMNFDYRLVFLVVPCVTEAMRLHKSHFRIDWILILAVVSVWFTLLAGNRQPFGDLAKLQPIGDLSISALVVYFICLYYRQFSKKLPRFDKKIYEALTFLSSRRTFFQKIKQL